MTFRQAIMAALLFAAQPAVAAEVYEFPALGAQSGELRIEASGDIEAVGPLIRDFQKSQPGLAITYVDRLTNELYERLVAACEDEKPVADLVFSSSADHMVKLANDGCAQAHVSGETRRSPSFAVWHDEVFGFTYEPAVIVYNAKLVPARDVPRTRDELADLLRAKAAFYHGRVGTYDIARSGIGYLFGFFDAEQSSVSGRLVEALGRADAKLACCTGDLLREIESGRILIGYNLLGSYAYGRYKAGAPIGIVLPRDYALVLSRAALVPRHAARPEAGKRFLDYLLSARGQKLAAQEAFFFAYGKPAPQGVDAAGDAWQAGASRPIVIGPSLLAATDRQKRARILKEWQQSFREN